jgi:hypothetical protein
MPEHVVVVWNGSKDHPGGRQLIADEYAPVFPSPEPRTAYNTLRHDTTKTNMGRRQMPRCEGEYCLNRVDTTDDHLCRLCKTL